MDKQLRNLYLEMIMILWVKRVIVVGIPLGFVVFVVWLIAHFILHWM